MNKEEIKKLAKSGTAEDIKKLIKMLDSDSPGIVESVQNALANIVRGEKELIKKLMDSAASPSFSIRLRSNSFDVLKQLAMRNGNFLADYAGKNSGKYDRITAELMRYGRFTPPDFPKKALKALANSKDEITMANAIESSGILKIDLGNILFKALKGNFFALSAALFSIGELKLKKAFPKLKEILSSTDDRVVKNIITESLSKIGGDEITDFFRIEFDFSLSNVCNARNSAILTILLFSLRKTEASLSKLPLSPDFWINSIILYLKISE